MTAPRPDLDRLDESGPDDAPPADDLAQAATTTDRRRLQLVPSAEPSVVFTSLATQCVPDLCDDCTIDIVDGADARYRIIYPPRITTGGLLRLADRAAAAAATDHQVRIPFAHPGPPDENQGFHGAATFVWHRRTPTHGDRTMANLLVEHALVLLVRQRTEHEARTALKQVENLEIALQSSRQIGIAVGILMSLHKTTQDQAFQLLSLASQRSNKKLRHLALDVVDTGWLDPALVVDAARPSRSNANRQPATAAGSPADATQVGGYGTAEQQRG